MKLHEITLLVNEILTLREAVELHRNHWHQSTKPQLEETFHFLKKNLAPGFGLFYDVNIFAKNLEAVVYSLGSAYSGIVQEDDESDTAYLKHFGHLVFGQLHNGEISVIISLPFVEELVMNTEPEIVLATLKPSELVQSKILDLFRDFLAKIVEWEKNLTEKEIEFRHSVYA